MDALSAVKVVLSAQPNNNWFRTARLTLWLGELTFSRASWSVEWQWYDLTWTFNLTLISLKSAQKQGDDDDDDDNDDDNDYYY